MGSIKKYLFKRKGVAPDITLEESVAISVGEYSSIIQREGYLFIRYHNGQYSYKRTYIGFVSLLGVETQNGTGKWNDWFDWRYNTDGTEVYYIHESSYRYGSLTTPYDFTTNEATSVITSLTASRGACFIDENKSLRAGSGFLYFDTYDDFKTALNLTSNNIPFSPKVISGYNPNNNTFLAITGVNRYISQYQINETFDGLTLLATLDLIDSVEICTWSEDFTKLIVIRSNALIEQYDVSVAGVLVDKTF